MPSPSSRIRVWTWLYLGLVGAGVAAMVGSRFRSVADLAVRLDPAWVMASLLASLAALPAQAAAWRALQTRVNRGNSPGGLAWLHAYLVGHLGRYVPGKAAMVAGRMLALHPHGFTRGGVAYASVLELVFSLVAAALLGVLVAGTAMVRLAPGWMFPAGALLLAGGAALLGTSWFERLTTALVRRAGGGGLDQPTLSAREKVGFLALHMPFHILNGIAFACALVALGTPLGLAPTLAAVGSAALATAAGTVVVIAPGGLGVREAITTGLLSPWVAPELTLAAAVVWRILQLAAELFLFTGVAWPFRRHPPAG